MKISVDYVWHKECNLPKVDLVVIPGGFSYGDYLRTGAIARFSPVMEAVQKHAEEGQKLHVQVMGEEAVVPDIPFIEKLLADYLKKS